MRSTTLYIVNYGMKKQMNSSNVSAFVAEQFVFRSEVTREGREGNERPDDFFLRRWVDSFSQDRQVSVPEAVNCFMGYRDGSESLRVTIYWEAAVQALLSAFPSLSDEQYGPPVHIRVCKLVDPFQMRY